MRKKKPSSEEDQPATGGNALEAPSEALQESHVQPEPGSEEDQPATGGPPNGGNDLEALHWSHMQLESGAEEFLSAKTKI